MEESQRSAMFNAWKQKNDAKVKKCYCKDFHISNKY